jgi:hypothetical protein
MKPVSLVLALMIFTLPAVHVCFGEKLNVKIIQRQNNESEYTYVVPGHYNSTSDANVNCNVGSSNMNCSGTQTTQGSSTAPSSISYTVMGATFSLLLPDGRVAVVNCVSKTLSAWGAYGRPMGLQRSCRTPLVNDIVVDFKGKNAKLMWSASIDGKKFESETYKILAVLDR